MKPVKRGEGGEKKENLQLTDHEGARGSCQCAQAIHFISQQSRFHLETLETPSKDLDIPGIQLSIGDTKLLEDAQLRLFSGAKAAPAPPPSYLFLESHAVSPTS